MYKADANQAEIIKALRAAGCSVSVIGGANGNNGVPDLLVGRAGRTFLLEVKMPGKNLSPVQEHWRLEWRGQSAVVRTVGDALHVVGLC